MKRFTVRLLILFASVSFAGSLLAQDTRNVTEPSFPPTCAVLAAPLQSGPDGPVLEQTLQEQNAESDTETETLMNALNPCHQGQAVELTLGSDPDYDAFLINPIEIPKQVSLIVDAGVTVFATRDPSKYQDPATLNENPQIICGTIGVYPPVKGCVAFLTLLSNSGIYGYGIFDGQGNRTLLSGDAAGSTWWDLTHTKGHSEEQASPKFIRAGKVGALASNITLYKFTIRNPPYHIVNFTGDKFTAWGLKIQAPWNIPNTDGFDLEGTNITVYDSTVSVGDQEVAIGASGITTSNLTIDHFAGYNKGGITILGNGDGTVNTISNILVSNAYISADLPSLVGTTVNGVPEQILKKMYGLQSYGQALPAAMNDNKALQITYNMNNQQKPGVIINNVTYKSICIQDIAKPLQFVPLTAFTSSDNLPTLSGLTFKDVHVLPPTAQFPLMGEGTQRGIPVTPPVPGGYQLAFTAYSPDFVLSPLFDNVVFDDVDGQSSILGVPSNGNVGFTAIGNMFTTQTNVYPPILNLLYAKKQTDTPIDGITVDLASNDYASRTDQTSPDQAYPCASKPTFMVGDLFASIGTFPESGNSTNRQYVEVVKGNSFTLNAVLQPAMSQTTLFLSKSYSATPGLVAVAAPALRKRVEFFEGYHLVGAAEFTANGTLARLTLKNVRPGIHTYHARYPGDAHYDKMHFGSVVVNVLRR